LPTTVENGGAGRLSVVALSCLGIPVGCGTGFRLGFDDH